MLNPLEGSQLAFVIAEFMLALMSPGRMLALQKASHYWESAGGMSVLLLGHPEAALLHSGQCPLIPRSHSSSDISSCHSGTAHRLASGCSSFPHSPAHPCSLE